MFLPFLFWAAKLYLSMWLHQRRIKKQKNKPEIIDVTPKPAWHFPVIKLLIVGLIFLAVSLIGYRILGVDADQSWQGNEAKSEVF